MKTKLVVLACLCVLNGCIVPAPTPARDFAESDRLIQHGVAALRVGKLEEADASFEVAFEVAPQAAALDGRGCVALLRGDSPQAERFFLRALEFDPEYRGALANLALLYEMSGRRQEALELYSAAVRHAPHNAAIRNNYAAALRGEENTGTVAQGQSNSSVEAIRELRKAHVLAPHPIIMRNLTRMEAP